MTKYGDTRYCFANVSITTIAKKYLEKSWGGVYRIRRYRLGVQCGFSIPLNTCGKGLCIAHIGPIIVSEKAAIGEYCKIHVGVNIGADARNGQDAPAIGNHVYIGPGAKLFGKITIADQIAIGANSVVNKDFLTPAVSIAGVPAKVINDKGVKNIIDIT